MLGTRTTRAIGSTVVGLAAAALVVAGTPAVAAPTWLGEVAVFAQPHYLARDAVVDVDAEGTATVAYYAYDELDGGGVDERVVVATRSRSATSWGQRQELPGAWFGPTLDVNAAGAAAVTYESQDGVMVAVRPAGQATFDDPVEVAGGPEDESDPVVAVAPNGRVTVVYVVRSAGPAYELVARHWRAGSGWSTPDVVAPAAAGDIRDAHVVADGESSVTVAWATPPDGTVHVATRPVGGSFVEGDPLNGGALGVTVDDVAVGADGTVAVSWQDGVFPTWTPYLAVRHAGQEFTDGIELQAPGGFTAALPLAVGADGTVATAFTRSNLDVSTVVREPDGALVLQQLPHDRVLSGPTTIGIDAQGAVTVTYPYSAPGSQGTHLNATRRPPGGSFAPPARVTADREDYDAEEPVLAVDPLGDATAVYLAFDSSLPGDEQERIGSVVLDVSGPALAWTEAGPGIAGRPLPLAVAPSDRSAPVSVTWAFGDGSAGAGAATTHSYAAAGTYTVTVTAADAVGNATTATRQVVVSAAAPAADTTPPVLSRAALSPRRLPTGTGARLRVTSSEAARLVGEVQRRKDGRWKVVGVKRWGVQAGANVEKFYGKATQRRLKDGRYRVLLTAADAAGNASATVRLRFRVDRA